MRAKTKDGGEPLHWAAENSNAEAATAAVQALVSAGADVRAKDKDGAEPLHRAAENGSVAAATAAVQALVAAGADLYAVDSDGTPPVLLVLQRGMMPASSWFSCLPLSGMRGVLHTLGQAAARASF